MTHASELTEALQACATLYAAQFTEQQAVLYADILKDFEIGRLRSAIRAHIQHPSRGRFFPKPADIIASLPDLKPHERKQSSVAQLDHKPRASEQTIRENIAAFDRHAADTTLTPHFRDLAKTCGDWWRNELKELEQEATA